VIGGGSQNRYLMQYTADALEMPVICGPVEGTALGNVLVQLKTAGIVSTLSQMRAISAASVELKTYLPQNNK
jgi:rhamnulokinase